MIVVHHLNNSRSQRILWLLEELGVPYEVKRYERDRKTMLAPPELRAVHPLGKSPVVTDGERTLAESGAIVEYLVERYGQPGEGALVPPPGTPERLRYTYWMHYAEGSAMPPLLLKLIFDRIESAPMPFFVRPIARGIARKVKGDFVRVHRRGHPDELSGRRRRVARRAHAGHPAASVRLPDAHPRASGLPARPRAGRPVRDRPGRGAVGQVRPQPGAGRAIASTRPSHPG
jgi:glutathione S-transferase